jgi:hypothetical protein
MNNREKYPLVFVQWEDIISTDTSWRELDDAIHWIDTETGIVNQVGFLLEKHEDYVILMDSFFEEGDTIGAITRIPKNTVKYFKILKIQDII